LTEFDAIYYDGKTSARNIVRVRAQEDSLHIAGVALGVEVRLAEISVDAPISGARRVLQLPGGAQLQTDDESAVDVLFPRANRLERWVHALERSWRYALAALVALVVFVAWCIYYGLPMAAEFVARSIPRETEANLGQQTLRAIDASLCAPTKLEASRQQSLRADFDALTAGLADAQRYRLELRACDKMGPNAFALPGGAIVLTDALVGLAQNDAQVSAVLAHEIGHVRYRHGLRQMLQAAGLAALISALSGDATSITGLAVALPTLLLQYGYSREFENEADGYALQRLKEIGLSPRDFAEILKRLDDFHNKDLRRDAVGKPTQDYLSTHPSTARRIERILSSP
jgi:predicted Zn-dependent protease